MEARTLATPQDLARYLNVKLPRVYELVRARRLRAIRVGRQLRFRYEDVDEFLKLNGDDQNKTT